MTVLTSLSRPPVLSFSVTCSEPASNVWAGIKIRGVLLLQITNLKDEFAPRSSYLYLKGVFFGYAWGFFVFIDYLGSTVCGYDTNSLHEECADLARAFQFKLIHVHNQVPVF